VFYVAAFLIQLVYFGLLLTLTTFTQSSRFSNLLLGWILPISLPFALLLAFQLLGLVRPTMRKVALAAVLGSIVSLMIATVVACMIRGDCF
jgi:hypothetical protein